MSFYASLGLAGAVLAVCVIVARATRRLGFVSLLFHLALGLAAGVTGLVSPTLVRAPGVAQGLLAAVAFVLFTGGWSTSLTATRPSHARGAALGVAGTLGAAAVAALAARAACGASWPACMALGAAVSCADMGVLMALVRGRHLSLRRSPAATLELEAGLSTPTCLLAVTFATSLGSGAGAVGALLACAQSLAAGLACGGVVALAARAVMLLARRRDASVSATFACGMALVAVALPGFLGTDGCLCAWFAGLAAGNVAVRGHGHVTHFFDGLRTVIHMGTLFALGVACAGSDLLAALPAGTALFCAVTLVGRPAATALVTAVRPPEMRMRAFLAAAGLRGPAALTIALVLATGLPGMRTMAGLDALGVTFWVCVLSLAVQGFAVPALARRLGMTACGEDSAVRTFTDFESVSDATLVELTVREGGWAGKTIAEVDFAPEALVVLVRRGGDELVPQGSTRLEAGDRIILSVPAYVRKPGDAVRLAEEHVGPNHPWAGRTLAQASIPPGELAVLVRRGDETLTPSGATRLAAGDVVVLAAAQNASPVGAARVQDATNQREGTAS